MLKHTTAEMIANTSNRMHTIRPVSSSVRAQKKTLGLAKIIKRKYPKALHSTLGDIDFYLYYWNQFNIVHSLKNNLWTCSRFSLSYSAG